MCDICEKDLGDRWYLRERLSAADHPYYTDEGTGPLCTVCYRFQSQLEAQGKVIDQLVVEFNEHLDPEAK